MMLEKWSLDFSAEFNTKWVVQTQKKVRSLKFYMKGRENECIYNKSRSHGQDGYHAITVYKKQPHQKSSLVPECTTEN